MVRTRRLQLFIQAIDKVQAVFREKRKNRMQPLLQMALRVEERTQVGGIGSSAGIPPKRLSLRFPPAVFRSDTASWPDFFPSRLQASDRTPLAVSANRSRSRAVAAAVFSNSAPNTCGTSLRAIRSAYRFLRRSSDPSARSQNRFSEFLRERASNNVKNARGKTTGILPEQFSHTAPPTCAKYKQSSPGPPTYA